VAARLAIDRGDLFTGNTLISRLPEGPSADLLEARLLLATAPDQARPLLAATQLPPRMRRLAVEHGLLTALALSGDDQAAAEAALETALLSAQEGGFLMSVVREGRSVWKLLESLPARAMVADYVALLLDAADGLVPPSRALNQESLIDPLSERELTVLRHLASRLDSTEIAGTLYLSVNTVRSHIKAVYRKLGVNTRTEAVNRGRELALF
jgi:LuxR family maltose regulon positive regulatory protein